MFGRFEGIPYIKEDGTVIYLGGTPRSGKPYDHQGQQTVNLGHGDDDDDDDDDDVNVVQGTYKETQRPLGRKRLASHRADSQLGSTGLIFENVGINEYRVSSVEAGSDAAKQIQELGYTTKQIIGAKVDSVTDGDWEDVPLENANIGPAGATRSVSLTLVGGDRNQSVLLLLSCALPTSELDHVRAGKRLRCDEAGPAIPMS